MGTWGINERQSDYGMNLLETIVATQLKAVDFAAFHIADAWLTHQYLIKWGRRRNLLCSSPNHLHRGARSTSHPAFLLSLVSYGPYRKIVVHSRNFLFKNRLLGDKNASADNVENMVSNGHHSAIQRAHTPLAIFTTALRDWQPKAFHVAVCCICAGLGAKIGQEHSRNGTRVNFIDLGFPFY